MKHGDSSGTQKGQRPPLEAGIRVLVKDRRLERLSANRSELQSVKNRVILNCNYELEVSNKSSYQSKPPRPF
jgi:hypothetical protein